MIDRLQQMLNMQHELQLKINAGHDVDAHTIEEHIDAISLNVLACTDELHEMLGEMGWKPWATSRHINFGAAQREIVDAWHFLMNIMLHLGMTGDDLYRLYREKNAVNHERQDTGYDGVSGKCQQCHRDIAEADVKEVIAQSSNRVDIHCACGAYLGSRTV